MVMMIKNGEIQFEHSSSSSSSSLCSPTKSTSSSNGDFEQHPKKGDLLVVRQMFSHVHKYIDDSQREIFFRSRCLINNKVYVLIIDGGS